MLFGISKAEKRQIARDEAARRAEISKPTPGMVIGGDPAQFDRSRDQDPYGRSAKEIAAGGAFPLPNVKMESFQWPKQTKTIQEQIITLQATAQVLTTQTAGTAPSSESMTPVVNNGRTAAVGNMIEDMHNPQDLNINDEIQKLEKILKEPVQVYRPESVPVKPTPWITPSTEYRLQQAGNAAVMIHGMEQSALLLTPNDHPADPYVGHMARWSMGSCLLGLTTTGAAFAAGEAIAPGVATAYTGPAFIGACKYCFVAVPASGAAALGHNVVNVVDYAISTDPNHEFFNNSKGRVRRLLSSEQTESRNIGETEDSDYIENSQVTSPTPPVPPKKDEEKKTSKMPTKENKQRLNHSFPKSKTGHVPYSDEIYDVLNNMVRDSKNHLGPDQHGCEWFSKMLPNGEQMWARSQKGEVISSGINKIPKKYCPIKGLIGTATIVSINNENKL